LSEETILRDARKAFVRPRRSRGAGPDLAVHPDHEPERDPTPEAVVAQLLDVVGLEHSEEIMTAGEVLIERGRKEMQEGNLLKLLRSRFGALPETTAARIHAADTSRLGEWFDRALRAATLEEVLDGA
jgi:hypothetical protein